MTLFKLLSTFMVSKLPSICPKTEFPLKKWLKFSFLYFFLLFVSFYGFAAEWKIKTDLKNGPCQLPFQQYISPLNPINPNNLTVIQERLKTKQDIGGAVTLSIEQPFSPETAEKLHKLLLSGTIPYLSGSHTFSNHLKHILLVRGSKYISLDEVIEIEQGFERRKFNR